MKKMAFAGYELETKYCFCDSVPVKMYFIAGMPFTFDALENEQKQDKWILSECAVNPEFTMEYIYQASDYLIAEECHPMLFEVEVRNPELMPDDPVS